MATRKARTLPAERRHGVRDDEIDEPASAVGAAPAEVDEGRVTMAGGDQGLQVRVGAPQAAPAGEQDGDVAGLER